MLLYDEPTTGLDHFYSSYQWVDYGFAKTWRHFHRHHLGCLPFSRLIELLWFVIIIWPRNPRRNQTLEDKSIQEFIRGGEGVLHEDHDINLRFFNIGASKHAMVARVNTGNTPWNRLVSTYHSQIPQSWEN